MSRIIKFAEAGGPDVLKFIETEVVAPGAVGGPHQGQGYWHQPRRVDVAHECLYRSGHISGGSGV